MEEVEIINNGKRSKKRLKMANNAQINSNNNRRNSIVEETKEDRLSALPDEILLQILSHLETFYAAKTAFFSRRWRSLWKGLTTYELHNSSTNFNKASELLSLLTSRKICVFEYSFYGKSKNLSWKSAEIFYRLLFRRNVEVLKLRSISISTSCSSAYLPVPNCVFNCENLVVLELDGKVYWKLELDEVNDLPVNGTSINLPNLKKLLLRVNGDDYCLLRTLLKVCPNLEELSLLLELSNEEYPDLDLVAANINSLNIEVVVPASSSAIVIDAPKLTKLKIRDPCSYYVFASIPTKLVEVSIKLKRIEDTNWFPVDDEFNDWTVDGHTLALSEFVRGMSSVRYLKVQYYDNMLSFFGPQYYGDMAVFPDLTFFKTTIDSLGGWEDLLRSLHCFPNLEHLELKLDEFYIVGPHIWVAPIVLPKCLLTKLKRVTVKKARRIIHEVMLLEFILSHANVLEELCIYSPSGSGSLMEYNMTKSKLLWTEYNFCQALFKLPRSSLTCEVVFSGVCINASSKAFEKELLGCQIRTFEKLGDSVSEY